MRDRQPVLVNRVLRFHLLVSLVCSCLPHSVSAQTPLAKDKLQLKVQTSKERYNLGDMVPVRIEFTNRSEQSIKLGFEVQAETEENLSVLIQVLDSEGKLIQPRLAYHLSPYGSHVGRDFRVTLGPKRFYGWDLFLTPYIYDCLNKPGIYQVRVVYGYHPPNIEDMESKPEMHPNSGHEPPPIFAGRLESELARFSVAGP